MRKLVYSSIISLFIISGILFVKWMQKPSTGTISNDYSKDVLSASKSTKVLITKQFSTKFDSTLEIKTENLSKEDSGYSQHLLSSKSPNDASQVAITVGRIETSLSEISPIKFRDLETIAYSRTTIAFAPQQSIVFTRNDSNGYEIAVFWQNDNSYSAVVGSGVVANKQSINERVSDVVTNWQWLQ